MEGYMIVTPEHTGILAWFIWALIGVAAALITQRIAAQPGMLVFNIIVGIAGALIGGFLSVQFVGDTPTMLLLISILGAIFGAGILLWITAALYSRFSRRP